MYIYTYIYIYIYIYILLGLFNDALSHNCDTLTQNRTIYSIIFNYVFPCKRPSSGRHTRIKEHVYLYVQSIWNSDLKASQFIILLFLSM